MELSAEQISEIIKLAQSAADKIMELYSSATIKTEKKQDSTPVTNADMASNQIIVTGLREMFPQIPVVSEEEDTVQEIDQNGPCWLVDPLDGTKEFLAENGEFCINIALVIHRHPVFGLIVVPVEKLIIWAQAGKGVWKAEGGLSTRLTLEKPEANREPKLFACSRSHINKETYDFMDRYLDAEIVEKGAAIKYLLLAERKADIYPRFGRTMEWDTAAGHIILVESGGILKRYDGGELLYMKPGFVNDSFIAYAAGIKEA